MIIQLNNRFVNLATVQEVELSQDKDKTPVARYRTANSFVTLRGEQAEFFANGWSIYFELVNKTAQHALLALNQERESFAKSGVILPS